MNFTGFSIPDGAYLPPELIYLLPNMSGSKLKVIIVVLYNYLQISSSEPASLTDIEKMTGLSRQSVISALHELIEDDKLVGRQAIGNSYVYFPVVKFLDQAGLKIRPFQKMVQKLDYPGELRESDRELNTDSDNSLSDSLNLSGDAGQKIRLVTELRAAGVYLKTAQDLVKKNDETTIERHLDYYLYALENNLAQGPGWLVLSLKESWQAPLGYQPNHRHEARPLPDDYDPLCSRFAVCMYCNSDPCICGKEAFYRCSECGGRPCECGAEAYSRAGKS